MIPADLASRLRLVAQDQPQAPQPLAPIRQLNDALSELSAGQRIMVEIQALLPNGMYRAVVAQREMALALPFSAKPGDVLELEVQESEGKLGLAFVANRSAPEAAEKGNESVSTTLSKAGNLIGNLLNEVEQQGGRAKPAALNANQPLVVDFPKNPADLVPILKDSLAKSGMFYEAHQARWVEGKLSATALLQEPQGKLSTTTPLQAAGGKLPGAEMLLLAHGELSALPQPSSPAALSQPLAGFTPPPGTDSAGENSATPGATPGAVPAATTLANSPATTEKPGEAALPGGPNRDLATRENLGQTSSPLQDSSNLQRPGSPIHPDLNNLVQQQLNALATQTYVWQGQVWPGQNMHWEITEDGNRPPSSESAPANHWQTRLRLDLPKLGGVEATLRLGSGGQLELSMITENTASQDKLQAAGVNLNQSLEAAGLQLSHFSVSHGEISR